jgi:DNA mismatch endonuclease (patch repair protein)
VKTLREHGGSYTTPRGTTKLKRVLFVNGCFWHLHDCGTYRMPKSDLDYWLPKLRATKMRDEKNIALLKQAGWESLTLWACELRDSEMLTRRICGFLGERQTERDRPLAR